LNAEVAAPEFPAHLARYLFLIQMWRGYNPRKSQWKQVKTQKIISFELLKEQERKNAINDSNLLSVIR